ncbi:LysR family transcriptional regulator [Sphingobium sp. Sx8-8]|uniref:LysR family transcriptional regulator n=1 Tax=Sphingobium sp. Sx8-8 TaxID=2933617 RepID=UPI001F59DA2B|nr:LysR family transcriptional regulator [Sphingobium sp. Sx8-8]
MMDLNLLRVLDALFAHRSVSGAARALGTTQPGVSLALRRLRAQFEDELFVRQGNEMVPTLVAERLAEPVMKVMASVRSDIMIAAPFDPPHSNRCFTLALSDLGELTFLPDLIAALRERAPGVQVRSVNLPPAELRQGLAGGSVDLALGFVLGLDGESLFTQTLFRQGFGCLVREGWGNGATVMTLDHFLAADHVVVEQQGRSQEVLERHLRKLGLHRRTVLRSPHFITVPLLVAGSDMVATVPLGVGRIYTRLAPLRFLPLPFETPEIPLQQIWHRRSHNDPGSIWLRRLVAELFMGRDPMLDPKRS